MILQETENSCQSCKTQFTGKYCNSCGEKVIDPHERTLKFFFGQLINALTFADTKFLRTLKLLFTKPGLLSLEYTEGRKKLYTPPMALFFIGNLLYFLFQPIDTFNTSFASQTAAQVYSSLAQTMAENKAADMEWEDLEINYNNASTGNSKLFLFLIVLMFSIPVSLVFYSKSGYYFNHLIFSLHFCWWLIYCFMLLLPVILFLVSGLVEFMGFSLSFDINGTFFSLLTLALIFSYLFLAVRRFYQGKTWILAIKTLSLCIFSLVVVIAYRFVLFALTIWTI